MTDDELRVAGLIRYAFQGVKLGNGIGLQQAQGLDDYADFATVALYRTRDEKDDWTKIPSEALCRCYSSLSFFDAEGMRFHLPAFLIATLEGTFDQDVIFSLTYTGHQNLATFDLLTDAQRNAVREYLGLRLANQDCEFERPLIERALADYWNVIERGR